MSKCESKDRKHREKSILFRRRYGDGMNYSTPKMYKNNVVFLTSAMSAKVKVNAESFDVNANICSTRDDHNDFGCKKRPRRAAKSKIEVKKKIESHMILRNSLQILWSHVINLRGRIRYESLTVMVKSKHRRIV